MILAVPVEEITSGQLYFPEDDNFENGEQWGFHQESPYLDVDVNAPQAWDVTKGSWSQLVAIMDSGMLHGHQEWASQQGKLHSSYNSRDPGGPTGDDYPQVGGHGTPVASIACALNDNGLLGVSLLGGDGVSEYGSRIMNIKATGEEIVSMTDASMANGITYAVNNGASLDMGRICPRDFDDAQGFPSQPVEDSHRAKCL